MFLSDDGPEYNLIQLYNLILDFAFKHLLYLAISAK
jgi:hypothetical protein